MSWTIDRIAAIQHAMLYGNLPAAVYARFENAEAYLFRRLERCHK